jgi:hypothetical protein
MRKRFVGFYATAVSLVVASCSFPSSTPPSCDDDVELCPHSSRNATSVTCDCKCSIGGGEDSINEFQGPIAACLPAPLNRVTASDEQRVALQALSPRSFDQRVFRYCSAEVAGFVRLAIKAYASLKLAACIMPVKCECKTAGTQRDSNVCHSTCEDVPCSDKNCRSILRSGSKLEIAACSCSRTSICGESAPADEAPGLCRDWVTTVR